MTTLREAAQQALEALELVTDLTNHDDEIYEAITALRAALAQEQAEPVQEPDSPERRCGGPGCDLKCCQPVQEPVAYRHLHEDGWEYFDAPTGEDCAGCQALYTAPPKAEPAKEPVYWEVRCAAHPRWMRVDEQQFDEYVTHGWEGQKLYTAPPKAEPLTEEEIYEMYSEPSSDAEMVAFARAVERAHGIGGQNGR